MGSNTLQIAIGVAVGMILSTVIIAQANAKAMAAVSGIDHDGRGCVRRCGLCQGPSRLDDKEVKNGK